MEKLDVRERAEETMPPLRKLAEAEGVTMVPARPMAMATEDEAYLRLGYPDGLRVSTDQPMTCSPIDATTEVPHNPLNEKGKKILSSMEQSYGKKKAKSVLYASKNKGTVKDID